MLLGDYGAEVVKVEPPGGDPFRATPGYTVWNRNKQSVILDLHDDADRAACRRLMAGADVVVESYSPGTTERLGIDYAAVQADNPGVVYCSITAYGRTGDARDRPGYDGLGAGAMGASERTARSTARSRVPAPAAAELRCRAASRRSRINAALFTRDRTGRGQWVETSLVQGALAYLTQIWKRAETPTPALTELWRLQGLPPDAVLRSGRRQVVPPDAPGHPGRAPPPRARPRIAQRDHVDERRLRNAARVLRRRP